MKVKSSDDGARKIAIVLVPCARAELYHDDDESAAVLMSVHLVSRWVARMGRALRARVATACSMAGGPVACLCAFRLSVVFLSSFCRARRTIFLHTTHTYVSVCVCVYAWVCIYTLQHNTIRYNTTQHNRHETHRHTQHTTHNTYKHITHTTCMSTCMPTCRS